LRKGRRVGRPRTYKPAGDTSRGRQADHSRPTAENPGFRDIHSFRFDEVVEPRLETERAGFGGAGGGLAGFRGDTYLDGDTLAIWPRDEIRGALLRRSVDLDDAPSLTFDAGADAGRTWAVGALREQ